MIKVVATITLVGAAEAAYRKYLEAEQPEGIEPAEEFKNSIVASLADVMPGANVNPDGDYGITVECVGETNTTEDTPDDDEESDEDEDEDDSDDA